jgi:hypothetical protein
MDNLTAEGPMFHFRQLFKLFGIVYLKTYCCSFYHLFFPPGNF